MNAKHFTLWLVSVFVCVIAYGQKIKYTEGQLQEWKSSSKMQLKVPYYRLPQMPDDVRSFSELKSTINNLDGWPISKGRFFLNGKPAYNYFNGYDSNGKLIINHKKNPRFEVYDDRWEIINPDTNKKLVIWFNDLQSQSLRVIKLRKYKDVEEHSVLELKDMWFEYNVDWLADYLYAIKYFLYMEPKIKQQKDSIATADSIQFSIQAAKYREMQEKPSVTEEQRKYIVQANSFAKEKFYSKAIEAYQKALAIDPVVYPAAYYNMALLFAEKKDFKEAVKNMKRYLLLVPDAPDARAAQDKIYEWER